MAEAEKWLNPAQYLFVPLVVRDVEGYSPPPANFREYIQRRLYYDPDPVTGCDRSLYSYISEISHGRAVLNARVSDPVTVNGVPITRMTLEAISAQPNAHLYHYVAVVYPSNTKGAGGGMHQPGKIPFTPPRSPNLTKARSRFLWNQPTGTWSMEIIHNVTMIGDYYNGIERLGNYEEMDSAAATHPCICTKLEAGWVDQGTVPWHRSTGAQTYALHAVGLPHPPNDGRVAAVRIQAPGSNRYLVVEARLQSDRWERGFAAARVPPELTATTYTGIDAEAVIVYEFSAEDDPWPRPDPNGPLPPLQLRAALGVGNTFTHFDSSTTTPGRTNNTTGLGRRRTITVERAIFGGFVIRVSTDKRPNRTGQDGTEHTGWPTSVMPEVRGWAHYRHVQVAEQFGGLGRSRAVPAKRRSEGKAPGPMATIFTGTLSRVQEISGRITPMAAPTSAGQAHWDARFPFCLTPLASRMRRTQFAARVAHMHPPVPKADSHHHRVARSRTVDQVSMRRWTEPADPRVMTGMRIDRLASCLVGLDGITCGHL